MKRVGNLARRDVLKGGLGLAALGLGSGFVGARPAFAAGPTVRAINATGALSYIVQVVFKERGYYEKFGVQVDDILVGDGSKILAALIGGDGDICCSSGFSTLFPAVEGGAKIKILAGSSRAPLTILYSNNPAIKSVKDLPGHTVGTGAPGALLHELTVGVLKKYGVDYKKVNFVNAGSSVDIFKQLVAKTIEVGTAGIEYQPKAEKYGLYPLVDGEFAKELPLFLNQTMYASERAIAEKRDGLVRIMAAYAAMFRWLSTPASKDDFINYSHTALGKGADDENTLVLWEFISKPGRLSNNLVIKPEEIEYVQDLNIELGIQKKKFAFDQVADMSLAEEALKMVNAAKL